MLFLQLSYSLLAFWHGRLAWGYFKIAHSSRYIQPGNFNMFLGHISSSFFNSLGGGKKNSKYIPLHGLFLMV